MRNPFNTSPFMSDVILTTVTAVLTILSFIAVTSILAEGLGPEKFGAYSLVRRILSTIEPVSTLAMGVAMSRYIAIADSKVVRANYFMVGMASILVLCFIIVVTGLCFKNVLTLSIFHSDEYQALFLAMLFLIVGYSFYVALYSLYRGLGMMKMANFWQIVVMAVIPLLIAIFCVSYLSVELIIFFLGVCFSSAMIPLIIFAVKAMKLIRGLKSHLKEMLSYALPRVPTQFAFAGILMVGPFIAPYFGGIKEAGYLVVSQSLLRVVEGSVEGFSRVALPAVARIFAEGRQEFLRLRINDLMVFIFHIGLFMTLHLFLWTDQIVCTWLGHTYEDVVPLMQLTALAIIPFIAYSMLRSIIDAVEEKAVNAYNLYAAFFISLLASLVMAYAGIGILGLAIGMIIGFWILGILTVRFLWKLYRPEPEAFFLKASLLLNAVCIAAAVLIKYGLESQLGGVLLLSVAFIIEILLFLLYCFALWKLSVSWAAQLMKRLVR